MKEDSLSGTEDDLGYCTVPCQNGEPKNAYKCVCRCKGLYHGMNVREARRKARQAKRLTWGDLKK